MSLILYTFLALETWSKFVFWLGSGAGNCVRVTVSPCPHCSWGSLAHGPHGNHRAISLIHGTYKKKIGKMSAVVGARQLFVRVLYTVLLYFCVCLKILIVKKKKKRQLWGAWYLLWGSSFFSTNYCTRSEGARATEGDNSICFLSPHKAPGECHSASES